MWRDAVFWAASTIGRPRKGSATGEFAPPGKFPAAAPGRLRAPARTPAGAVQPFVILSPFVPITYQAAPKAVESWPFVWPAFVSWKNV